jgi:hypothetical protein
MKTPQAFGPLLWFSLGGAFPGTMSQLPEAKISICRVPLVVLGCYFLYIVAA